MSNVLPLVLAALAGLVLGAIFFGGLWWTIRKGMQSPRPALWFLASFVLRTAIVVAGFYFVGDGQWQKLLACLAGFIIGRLIVTRMTQTSASKEGGHAS